RIRRPLRRARNATRSIAAVLQASWRLQDRTRHARLACGRSTLLCRREFRDCRRGPVTLIRSTRHARRRPRRPDHALNRARARCGSARKLAFGNPAGRSSFRALSPEQRWESAVHIPPTMRYPTTRYAALFASLLAWPIAVRAVTPRFEITFTAGAH